MWLQSYPVWIFFTFLMKENRCNKHLHCNKIIKHRSIKSPLAAFFFTIWKGALLLNTSSCNLKEFYSNSPATLKGPNTCWGAVCMSDVGMVMMSQKVMQTLSLAATIFRMAGGNEDVLSVYNYYISESPYAVVYLFLAINLWDAVGHLLHSWFLLQCAVYHVHPLNRRPFTLTSLLLLHIQCVHIYVYFRVFF